MKNSFILYQEHEEIFNSLTNEEAGKLIKTIFQYEKNQNIDDMDKFLKMAFIPIRQALDKNREKHAETCKARAEAGSKGGKQNKQTEANQANASDNEYDNEYEYEINNSASDESLCFSDLLKTGLTQEEINEISSTQTAESVADWGKEFEAMGRREEKPKKPKEKAIAPSDLELYHKINETFLSEQLGGRYTNYGKEGSSIYQLIEKAKARDPCNPEVFILGMIACFKALRDSDKKFFGGQPFLPSALNASGIFDRVLSEAQKKFEEVANYEPFSVRIPL